MRNELLNQLNFIENETANKLDHVKIEGQLNVQI